MASLVNVFAWESFRKLLLVGYENLALPMSDNASIFLDLVVFHAASDPLIFAIRTSLVFSFFCWFMSMATGTHSWVDRLWSITPVLYAIHFSVRDMLYWPKDDAFHYLPRVYIATALIFLWGARLTYNFYRKGGYTFDSEDYRWPYLGSKIPTVLWFFFNIFFICLFQNLLLVAITVPVYTAWRASLVETTPLNWIDAVATLLFISGFTLETIADRQQWTFQEKKRKAIINKEALIGDYKRGFLTQGLFRYSRHPNFFGEMTIWWSIYLFSVAAGYPTYVSWVNPSIVGAFTLTCLFQGSTLLTEFLTAKKYPSYKLYKKTTSRFIPLPAGTNLDELEKKAK
ncbi:hypothetical protein BCR41DRAFT_354319 [Lobosporangium transversale]|uniref:Uncharacterized protein n=1 Tax=Lobosporangium transversale TaxID=64571 RepID=A0A1Y2GLZ3_9FUNG|nr:hypothetical protein BCR41DRAFT_354319 [Lobosporangium transversale]ORZ14913.1 hypothetical protein BCR41DRAFT_354319 [Lobosporangium transversale]|eukprot:XP_021881045.1 hypothetical protein BCR41DRAFT_354319 [Lobosporangium transversale]